ncbi:dihydrofolate reductase family protein [Marinoscillum sp.]|uniref:dihydrofolate reductase family protein n=1 Tax=Marinoscillum sp. TaxID=2024838 RepID=UPI003BA890FC
MRKLILYIASSLDGYIAKPNDDLSFLNLVQKEGEDYGYNDFVDTVDTVIIGRKTYEWVINQGYDFPHADKESYIITRQERPKEGNLTFYTGSLKQLVTDLKKKAGKNIFCDGGSEIVHLLLKEKLIDELILSVIPILVGDGTPLFKTGRPEQLLELKESKSFESGLVQLHYAMKG